MWDTVLHRFVVKFTRDSREDMVEDEGKAETLCGRGEDGAGAVAANVLAMTVGAALGQKRMQSKASPWEGLRSKGADKSKPGNQPGVIIGGIFPPKITHEP